MKHLICFIITFFVLLNNSNAKNPNNYLDGADSSGGGLAVVCRNPDATLKSVEMYDLYESREIYGLHLVDNGLSMTDQLSVIEQKLKLIFKNVKLKKSPDQLLIKAQKDFKLLSPTVKLEPVDDGAPIVLPKFCQIEQAAFYKNNTYLLVDYELWNFMDDYNRAVLFAHEAIYMHERELGDKNSQRSRKIVAHLFSDYNFLPLMDLIPAGANDCIAHSENNIGSVDFQFYKFINPYNSSEEILQFTKFRGRFPYSITRVTTPLWPWEEWLGDQYLDVDSEIEAFDQLYIRQNLVSSSYYFEEYAEKHLIKCSNPPAPDLTANLDIRAESSNDFGNVTLGNEALRVFMITNQGAGSAKGIREVGLAPPFTYAGGSYPGQGGTCLSELKAGSSCKIIVSFRPISKILSTDSISLEYLSGTIEKVVYFEVSGAGLVPALLAIDSGPTYNFGLVATGGSLNRSFTITNTGGSTATKVVETSLATPFSFFGGSFPGIGGTCSSMIVAGSSCTIVIRFNPSATGPVSNRIELHYFNGGTQQSTSRTVQGTGGAPALLTISETDPYDFTNIPIGGIKNKRFVISNVGQVSATAISGGGLAAPFGFKGGSYPGTGGTCATVLASGSSCDVVVTFSPAGSGVSNDTFDINYSNGVNMYTSSRQVTGAGTAPAVLAISDSDPYDYGTAVIGGAYSRTFTVTNAGGATATGISEVGLSAPFSMSGGPFPGVSGTCSRQLAAGASCIFVVEYAPIIMGMDRDAIEIRYNDGSSLVDSTRSLTGSAVSPANLVVNDGGSFDLGNIEVNSYKDYTFTVTNKGSHSAFSVGGGFNSKAINFSGGVYPGVGGSCGASLNAAADCTIVVRFTPITLGLNEGSLSLTYNNGAQNIKIDKHFTGQGAALGQLVIGSSGETISFLDVKIGQTLQKSITVFNVASGVVFGMTDAGGLQAPFKYKGGAYPGVGGTCGNKLAAQDSCELVIEFSPMVKDSFGDSIGIFYNNGISKQVAVVYLIGAGI